MENLERIKTEVLKKYEEMQDYTIQYNKISQKQKVDIIDKNREIFMKNPEDVDITSIAKDVFFVNGIHQTDIRKMQVQFIDIYDFVKSVFPEMELPEEVTNNIKVLKNNLPKQVFTLENGEFKEIEEGHVKSLIDRYEASGFLKSYEAQIKNILNA